MLMSVRFHIQDWRLLLLAIFVLPLSAVVQAADHLQTDPQATPYQTKVIKVVGAWSDHDTRTFYCMADIDGDGVQEMIEGMPDRAIGMDGEDGRIKNRWQINLEPGWKFHRFGKLGVVSDLNRDGIDEIYTTITNAESGQWRFVVLDPAQEKLVFSAPLPTGPDRRPDGIWDGQYYPNFLVNNADGRGRPGVICSREVQYDAYPRGLVAIDPFTGQIIWEWLCGPNPALPSVQRVNMGSQGEGIAFFGNAPQNLGGEEVNGTSDDHAYAFLISATGELIWQHRVGPGFCGGGLVVADISGDGDQEMIIFSRSSANNVPDQMSIWDWHQDRPLAQTRSKAMFDGVVVLAGPRPGTSWIITGSDQGVVSRYLYADSTLVQDKSILSGDKRCTITGALDFLPDPGKEVILSCDESNRLVVLDRNLETLAVYQDRRRASKSYPEIWQLQPDLKALVVGSDPGYWVLEFPRRPLAWGPILARTGMVAGAIGLLLAVYFLGRKIGREGAAKDGEISLRVADREVLYRLWLDLDDVKHERLFEPSKGFRRLVWLLDAYTTDLGSAPELADRIQKLLADFQETDLPLLRGILSRAEGEGLAPETVGHTTMVLASAAGKLETLDGDNLTVVRIQAVQQELAGDLQKIEEGFLDLWRTLGEFYTADPVRLIQGMMLTREIEFKRAGITVNPPEAVSGPVYFCRIDTSALRFVLENLVDNAVRAVRSGPGKEITISLKRQDLEIVLGVSDTGKGIAPEDQERIFSGRFSSRGGGQGLFRSREILRRWRGEIELAESSPDQGTKFILRLPVAVKNVATRASSAQA